MAVTAHLDRARSGTAAWNDWRNSLEGRDVIPDLSDGDLTRLNLEAGNLSDALMGGSEMQEANLRRSDISGCDARRASFYRANISGITAVRANMGNVDLFGANAGGGNFTEANWTNLSAHDTNLEGAILRFTVMRKTHLRRSLMARADLYGADMRECDITGVQGLTADQLRQVGFLPVNDEKDLFEGTSPELRAAIRGTLMDRRSQKDERQEFIQNWTPYVLPDEESWPREQRLSSEARNRLDTRLGERHKEFVEDQNILLYGADLFSFMDLTRREYNGRINEVLVLLGRSVETVPDAASVSEAIDLKDTPLSSVARIPSEEELQRARLRMQMREQEHGPKTATVFQEGNVDAARTLQRLLAEARSAPRGAGGFSEYKVDKKKDMTR